jgi:hypothetical protein
MSVAIFISYSHQDASLVKPVVGLLRATKDLVFQDVDSIKPGKRWREQIEEALHAAHLIVLFWCYHSSRSDEVRKEYELALSTGKDVLPVLLDTTPIPEELKAFQWVDFRQLVGVGHRSFKHWLTILEVLMLGFVLIFAAWYGLLRLGASYPPPDTKRFSPWLEYSALLALIVLTLVWLVRRVRQYRIRKKMETTLREELFRRGIGTT